MARGRTPTILLIRPEFRELVSSVLNERGLAYNVENGHPMNPPGTLRFKLLSLPDAALWETFNAIPPEAHAITLVYGGAPLGVDEQFSDENDS
jgi:hypothetical protein